MLQHLWNKLQKMRGWAAHFWMLIFVTYCLSNLIVISYTNTISNKIMGNYWLHKTTLYHIYPLTNITNSIQDFVSKVGCKSTFNPTTCYLLDYNLYIYSHSYLYTFSKITILLSLINVNTNLLLLKVSTHDTLFFNRIEEKYINIIKNKKLKIKILC